MGGLEGKRVLVTRALPQAPDLCRLLSAVGAVPISIPVMELLPLLDSAQLQELRHRIDLGAFDDLVFTSANAVRLLLEGPRSAPRAAPRVFAIGPGTAAALEGAGWASEELPRGYIAESLAERMIGAGVDSRRVLLPRAQEAREVLPNLLRAAGAEVEVVALYRTRPAEASRSALRAALEAGELDFITFTSGSAVRSFLDLAGQLRPPAACGLACIGPVTAAELLRFGLAPQVVAGEHSLEGLVDALSTASASLPENGARP